MQVIGLERVGKAFTFETQLRLLAAIHRNEKEDAESFLSHGLVIEIGSLAAGLSRALRQFVGSDYLGLRQVFQYRKKRSVEI